MEVCENLATKAELQELRDQLNAAIGELENGGTKTIFEKGKGVAEVLVSAGGTLFGLTKIVAPKAIVDIDTQKTLEAPIWQELRAKKAKWLTTTGNGVKKSIPSLDKVGGVVGQNTKAATISSKAGLNSAASISVLSNLVSIAGTLAINIATVDILEKRIEAEARGAQLQIDAVNNGMIRLYEKNQGDINKVNQELSNNKISVETNRRNIEATRAEVLQAQNENNQLSNEIDQAQEAISDLQAQNQQLTQEIAQSNIEVTEITDDLTATVNTVNQQVEKINQTIATQRIDIEKQNKKIALIETKITDIDQRLLAVEQETEAIRQEFEKLKLDLEEDKDLQDARAKLTNARLVILENKTTKTGSGTVPVSVPQSTANAQTKILELTEKLTGNEVGIEEITTTDIYNQTDKFESQFENLLTDIGDPQVNQEQLDGLRTDLRTDFRDVLELTLQVGVIDALNRIEQQTEEPRLINATEQGICNSLNNPTCNINPTIPDQTNGLKGLKDKLQGQIDRIDVGLGLANLGANQNILGIVKNTNEAVRHAQYGLEAIQNFAGRAWSFTRADKIIAVANLMASTHNAAMLSRNLGETLGDVSTQTLQFFGIKAPDGSPIDVNEVIGKSIKDMIKGVIGEAAYTDVSNKWRSANRILTAASGMVYAIRGMKEAILEAQEVVGGWIAQIGNASQDQGIYEDDTYPWMNPNPDFRNPYKGFLAKIDNLEDVAGQVNNLVSSGIEFQESINETIDSSERLTTSLNEFSQQRKDEQDEALASNESPTVNNIDLVKKQGE